jgi:uncharacterized protein YkuJ
VVILSSVFLLVGFLDLLQALNLAGAVPDQSTPEKAGVPVSWMKFKPESQMFT